MGVAISMIMRVVVMVAMIMGKAFELERPRLASPGAMAVTVRAICRCADAFNVMVVALLNRADIGLKTQNLCSVFAHLAIHGDVAGEDLLNALHESFNDLRMVIEIGGFHEFDSGMPRCHFIGGVIDALHENSGEQEVREDDDAFEAEARHVQAPGRPAGR